MLKRITLLVLTTAFILSLKILAFAEESIVASEDSFNISDAVLAQMNTEATDDVLRIYNVPITGAFAEFDNIDEVLSSDHLLEILYERRDATGQSKYFGERKNKLVPIESLNLNEQAVRICKTGEITKNIADDVTVYNTYYLSGENDHMGSAIYYKTDKGDYVYYNYYALGEYLFPIDAFCAYQKAILNKMIEMGDLDGVVSVSDVWDLSPYDFKSEAFNLNAEIPGSNDSTPISNMLIIGIGIFTMLAIAAALYFRKRHDRAASA